MRRDEPRGRHVARAERAQDAWGEPRSPFLAPPLVELALSFPAAIKLRRNRVKPALTDALRDSLAPGVIGRPKQPFNPPVRGWLQKHMVELEDVLVGPRSELGHVLAPAWVRTEFEDFQSGKRDNSTLLWGLVTLAHWCGTKDRARLDHQPTPAARPGVDVR